MCVCVCVRLHARAHVYVCCVCVCVCVSACVCVEVCSHVVYIPLCSGGGVWVCTCHIDSVASVKVKVLLTL